MEISIFAKERRSREGRAFHTFFATLTKKDGTEVPVSVKFRKECGEPDAAKCPQNIIVDKEHCNLSRKRFLNESTGELVETNTLWVSQWAGGSEYVDHSMDDFED